MKEIEALIVRMATENKWGYLRITGALANLGHKVARTTIANVLKRHGIEPAPERKTTWKEFLEQHWDVLAATDFFLAVGADASRHANPRAMQCRSARSLAP